MQNNMNHLSWQYEVNDTVKDIDFKPLIGSFVKCAEEMPHKTAVINAKGEKYTYRQTAERAAEIAGVLIGAEAKKGDRVAVSLERSEYMIFAVLGVLWAGCVYVPVNCSQPEERRRRIYSKASVRCCITRRGSSADQITECTNIHVDALKAGKTVPMPHAALENETAYIIFTSGSTGEPKGVEIAHSSAWNTICDVQERFGINANDRALCVSALDFDLSVFDIFGLLSVGGTIVMLCDDSYKEPSAWKMAINECGVTVWNSVPALFEMLMTSMSEGEMLSSLNRVLLSGDWVRPELYELMKKHTESCRFFALGGATEASIWSNYFEVMEIDSTWDFVPYGRPLSNQMFRVIKSGKDCTDGGTGELWIGGKGVAKGYVGDRELTEAAFVSEGGQRWYKTGDYGYYLPDGNIVFTGRKDNQVKINGFRIELGEIEKRLGNIEFITKAVAVVKHGKSKNSVASAVEVVSEMVNDVEAVHVERTVELPENGRETAAALFIKDMLFELSADDAVRAGFDKGSEEIIRIWKDFCFAAEKKGVSAENCDREFYSVLCGKKELFKSILTGEASRLELIDDKELSPLQLMKSEGLDIIIDQITSSLTTLIESDYEKGSLLTVAVIMGRQGHACEKLLSALSEYRDRVEFLYFETSEGLLASAKELFDKYSLRAEFIRTAYDHISEKYFRRADAVLSLNGLHLFNNVDNGMAWIGLLLKSGGKIFAAESTKLTVLGLISAVFLEDGFTSYTDERRSYGMPMFTLEQWNVIFRRHNCVINEQREYPESYIAYFEVGRNIPDYDRGGRSMRELSSDKLLSYMIPEEFVFTARLPLTDNGKLDRRTVEGWFVTERAGTGREPHTNTEKKLAEIWKELLKCDYIYAEDHFFEVGGDSLLAARMINSVKTAFAVDILMRDVFDAVTLEKVAALIDSSLNDCDMEEGEL